MPTPADYKLAADLFDAGLAPKRVTRQEYQDGPVYWWGQREKWEPWRDIRSVWHLLLRYGIACFTTSRGEWGLLRPRSALLPEFVAYASSDADIPRAIAQMALKIARYEVVKDGRNTSMPHQ